MYVGQKAVKRERFFPFISVRIHSKEYGQRTILINVTLMIILSFVFTSGMLKKTMKMFKILGSSITAIKRTFGTRQDVVLAVFTFFNVLTQNFKFMFRTHVKKMNLLNLIFLCASWIFKDCTNQLLKHYTLYSARILYLPANRYARLCEIDKTRVKKYIN